MNAIFCESAASAEDARLAALQRYDLLDTPAEEAFDRITRLAKRIFRTPIATVTLIDGHRQWFKSRQGIDTDQTDREPALCYVVVRDDAPVIVTDALKDERFSDNPFVTGEPHIRFYAGAPLRTSDGHVIGALCVIDTIPRSFDEEEKATLLDLAQLVMDQFELRLLADADSLTGALSRRAFREEANRAVMLAHRHRHDLSVIALDLDHFKTVNDIHGHARGDAVLKASIAACQAELRKTDVVGRVGGEEFVALLPHTNAAAALEVAEKLRRAVARIEYSGVHGPFSVTASFGVASLTRRATDIDALLENADFALYRAKSSGRDRCVVWTMPEGEIAALRRRVFKGGRILFNKGASSVDCTVRTQSDTGAGLEVSTSAVLPDRFDLAIDSDGKTIACRVVQLSERKVEVEFA